MNVKFSSTRQPYAMLASMRRNYTVRLVFDLSIKIKINFPLSRKAVGKVLLSFCTCNDY